MKKILVGILTVAICVLQFHSVYASSNEIVTDKTYNPVNRDVSKYIDDTDKSIKKDNYSRSSAPYWKEDNGIKSFYQGNGELFAKDGKLVIDVSKWQGDIDWEKVKASGVDGAIIRLGYGYLGKDEKFKKNISECNRLKIPYGIYLYSYAYDANFAYAEAEGTVEMLKDVDLDLSFPIYYDIEGFNDWEDNGVIRKHPTKISEYEAIISTYINRMEQLGYKDKVHVYSYAYYLDTYLDSPNILKYVSWTAAYSSTPIFKNKYYLGNMGWQYSESGKFDGINGNVDMNCFTDYLYKYVVPFIDTPKSEWYYNAIVFAYNNQIILGESNTTFNPNGKLTRGMLTTILWRMEGAPSSSNGKNFPDVSSKDYFYSAIKWATSKGVVNGYTNGKFGPNDNITREQLAVMLRNYALYKGKVVNSNSQLKQFKDYKNVSSFALSAMAWAVDNGVISGKSNGTLLDPIGNATRAEVAAMINNYYNNVK